MIILNMFNAVLALSSGQTTLDSQARLHVGLWVGNGHQWAVSVNSLKIGTSNLGQVVLSTRNAIYFGSPQLIIVTYNHEITIDHVLDPCTIVYFYSFNIRSMYICTA